MKDLKPILKLEDQLIFHIVYEDFDGNLFRKYAFDLEALNEKPKVGYAPMIGTGKISHYATNFRIVGRNVIADITLVDTSSGRFLKGLLNSLDMVFRPTGVYTRINNSKEVFHFAITEVNAVTAEKGKFKKLKEYVNEEY